VAALDDPEVRNFLARSLVVQVATLSRLGRAFSTPLWFAVHGGALYITTGTSTRAARNVVAHPQVTLLFHGEHARDDDRVLRLKGVATCHAGYPAWPVLARIALRYYLAPQGLAAELRHRGKWRLRNRYYAQGKGGPGHIRVLPTSAEFLPRP
jgi:hypothetical protein